MLVTYLPVLVFSIIAIGVGIVPLLLAYLVAPRKENERKTDPYECGFNPIGEARVPFDVKYYLVAILFILFDLETTFLFPWAVQVLPQVHWVIQQVLTKVTETLINILIYLNLDIHLV